MAGRVPTRGAPNLAIPPWIPLTCRLLAVGASNGRDILRPALDLAPVLLWPSATVSLAQSFTLRFTFTTSAQSPQNVGGGDEAAARFGANGPLSGATADDYPGPGDVVDRIQANDGHFVNVQATLLTVPEPGTLMLLGAGCAGIAVAGGRKRS